VRDYFESLKNGLLVGGRPRYASAQYIVGLNGEIIRTMPEGEVAYACGAAGIADPASGKFYTDEARELFSAMYCKDPYSPNYVTINIEMCHPDWTGKFMSQTEESTLELVVDLFKRHPKLDDPHRQLTTHQRIVGHKPCPRWYSQYPDEFHKFQDKVYSAL
jgi:N-acetylmuramoyl-L-alanine amidase